MASSHARRPTRVLLAVSGSIAAYRAADIVSQLKKMGHDVRCLMTEHARWFVTPTVLETLSGHPVRYALFGEDVSGTEHIRLARWADVMVFAPATANLVAKLSTGLADDLVTTVALATRAPWVIAPAMNTAMLEHPATQANLATIRSRGALVVEPQSGTLACGEDGEGKLASPESVVEAALKAALPRQSATPQRQGVVNDALHDLAGVAVLITAGPTTSAIDAVRYVTNRSTGKMGAALAEEALSRGAEVYYVLGVDKGVVRPRVNASDRLHLVEVETAEEMESAALAVLPRVQGVIASAAVLDYRVEKGHRGKRKRAASAESVRFSPSVDVLASLRSHAKKDQWLFGFAAETDDVERNGLNKLKAKNLDYLFVNRVAKRGERVPTGFGVDTNSGLLMLAGARGPRREIERIEIPLLSKRGVAARIWDLLASRARPSQ